MLCHIRTGESGEDEWFLYFLFRKISEKFEDLSLLFQAADGDFLAIEAALTLPSWVTPETAEIRIWVRGGAVHLIDAAAPGGARAWQKKHVTPAIALRRATQRDERGTCPSWRSSALSRRAR